MKYLIKISLCVKLNFSRSFWNLCFGKICLFLFCDYTQCCSGLTSGSALRITPGRAQGSIWSLGNWTGQVTHKPSTIITMIYHQPPRLLFLLFVFMWIWEHIQLCTGVLTPGFLSKQPGDDMGARGIKPFLATCKASALHTVLSP